MTRHPGANQPRGEALAVGAIEEMPIVGKVKSFHTWNETTIATIETTDRGGRNRGGIAIGFSRHDRCDGVATYSTIEEAEILIQLLRSAIDDAIRIEAGQAPLAQEGRIPPTVQ